MLFTTVLLCLGLIAGSLAVPASLSEPDYSVFFDHSDASARIVGGTTAAEGSVPYMAALTNGLLIRSLVCGASVITPHTILTAAHCIDAVYTWNYLSSSLRVTVGTNLWNLGGGGVSHSIARNVTHEHYTSSDIKNDIGILITSSEIVLTDTIKLVPLSFEYVPAGVRVRAAGWGRISAGGAISTQLLELELTTIDGQQCIEDVRAASIELNMSSPPIEPHIELCTFHSEGHGMCNGDSGSALVRLDRGEQVGLVSWGFPCALGAPDMFVRLSAYQDWLARHAVL